MKPLIAERLQGRSWWHKIVAITALVNLLLVIFNLSYIPLRNIYLREIPPLVKIYDPIKAIEPHPDTSVYLDTVNSLAEQITQGGINTTSTEELFAKLRQQSTYLLTENPFSVANQFGTFAKLKRRMEYHLDTSSARQAFMEFWTVEYFNQVGPFQALNFFEEKIAPLLAVSYYRSIDENGQFIDYFWKFDLFFGVFFALEFLVRTLLISISQSNTSWSDMMLRRWYDTLMLLPIWRCLRIISVFVRLHQSGLINLERIIAQITYEPAAYLADRVSVFLMVRLINQTKEAIESGKVAKSLLQPQEYVQVSEINKIDAISDRFLELGIYKVLPKVQPEVEALLRHSLKGTLQQSDFYRRLQNSFGLEILPIEATDQIADYLAQSVYKIIVTSYSDLKGRELFENLAQNFKHTLRQELQTQTTQSELQLLLSELLQEVKLNYVQGSTQQNPEDTLSEAEQIRLSSIEK